MFKKSLVFHLEVHFTLHGSKNVCFFNRNLNLVMPQPVGQISLTGQHARVSVVKMETRQGKGHASSLKMEASHAQRKQLKHRHKSVELLASG